MWAALLIVGLRGVKRYRRDEEYDLGEYHFVTQSDVGTRELNIRAGIVYYRSWQLARYKRLGAGALATTSAFVLAVSLIQSVRQFVF